MSPIAPPNPHTSPTRHQPTSVKLRDSCDSCARSKVKCDREQPHCRRCIGRGTTCKYGQTRRIGRPRSSYLLPGRSVAPHLESDWHLHLATMPAPTARHGIGIGMSSLLGRSPDQSQDFFRAGRGAAEASDSAIFYTTIHQATQCDSILSQSYGPRSDIQNAQAAMPGDTALSSLPVSSSESGSSSAIDEHIVLGITTSPNSFNCCCISAILDTLRSLYTDIVFSPAPTLTLLPVGFERHRQITQLNKTLTLLQQMGQCRCLLDVDVVSMLKPVVAKTVDGCLAVVHTIHTMNITEQSTSTGELLHTWPGLHSAGGIHYMHSVYHAVANGLDSILKHLADLEQRFWPFAAAENRALEDNLLLDQLMSSMMAKVLLARQTMTLRPTGGGV